MHTVRRPSRPPAALHTALHMGLVLVLGGCDVAPLLARAGTIELAHVGLAVDQVPQVVISPQGRRCPTGAVIPTGRVGVGRHGEVRLAVLGEAAAAVEAFVAIGAAELGPRGAVGAAVTVSGALVS